jgi:phosphoenolpyruvate carboxykinase (ATP)
VKTSPDSVFGLAIPVSVPGVPDDVLNPRSTWADTAAYDAAAAKLAGMFRRNFEAYEDGVSEAVRNAGPR